jgi:ParB-like chromosome segregation protein Spo0J
MTTKPTIQRMKIADLIPHEKNPRKITKAAMDRLKRSLHDLGNLSPVTLNITTGRIIGGHQRLKAMAQLGETETDVWCVSLDEKKEKSALLQLNNHSGEWDMASLNTLLADLGDEEIELTGFSDDDINRIISSGFDQVKVEQPEKSDAPKTVKEIKCPHCGKIIQ